MPRLTHPIMWLVLSCGFVLQPTTAAQDLGIGDPRFTEDPRRLSDPRDVKDPREDQVKPGLEESLEPLRGPDLFEELYLDGNLGGLAAAIAETPWELTDYIYDLCAKWLRLTQDSEGKLIAPTEEAKELEAKLRSIARIADSSIGDTRFVYYVDITIDLTEEQRAQRVEQQLLLARGAALVDIARTKPETAIALTPLRQSLASARLLEDFRGQSRCQSLIGRVHILNSNSSEAKSCGNEAIRLGRSVRDLRSVWDGWATVMRASLGNSDFQGAKAALAEQHRLAVDIGDDIVAAAILDEIRELDRALGRNLPGSLIIYGPRIDQPMRRF